MEENVIGVSAPAYYIGLDIGTNSVGWAVTDPEYNIIRKNGKSLWGVRLFDEAQPAADRRAHRCQRRRYERRTQRIAWLNDVFAAEIAKVDPAFFERLRESKFLEEDKQGTKPLGKYTLFADKDYCDKDYYREFPTIYHLRKALIENEKPFDVRLVYLAVHHIMKYRGHFLFDEPMDDSKSVEAAVKRIQDALEYINSEELLTVDFDLNELKRVMLDRRMRKTARKAELMKQCKVDKNMPSLCELLALISGCSISLSKLFNDADIPKEEKFSLEDSFEDKEALLVEVLGDRLELILAAKELYDWARLKAICGDENYLSFAMVNLYEKHKADLKLLKEVFRDFGDTMLYREVFHDKGKDSNYAAYVGNIEGQKVCTYDKFSSFLAKKLKECKSADPRIESILSELDEGTFLPKQVNKDNGVIPHQLHEIEIKLILENASAYLPFLNETDESSLPLKERIVRMFAFRIPFYVGPLNEKSEFAWLTRSPDKIYPWNFSDVVDLKKSREDFIQRMTSNCSYICDPVLPKDSLLYTKFMVLNTINNLKIEGKPIPVSLKQEIYTDCFMTGKRYSRAGLAKYLKSRGLINGDEKLEGVDENIPVTLAPWKQLDWLIAREGGYAAAEDIIRYTTLFGQDKKLLADWLKSKYSNLLTAEEQKRVLTCKFSGWGSLSEKFLTGICHVDKDTGEALSIMDMLWNTNYNLMELLSDDFDFTRGAMEERKKKLGEVTPKLDDYLDDSYASPAIRRSIRQVMEIVTEITKIIGGAPIKIFIEVTREHSDKHEPVKSRKDQLIALYKAAGFDSSELLERLESKETDASIRGDKLFLYYTQQGKCMYSGRPIDLNRIDTDYDIDHIYPQSKTKDDSIDNRVLVERELNKTKSDSYPLSVKLNITPDVKSFWKTLNQKGFISNKKYERLTRNTHLTDDELFAFVNRQLVETSQSCKIIAELLADRFKGSTRIVYVKAGLVSDFRKSQRIIPKTGERRMAHDCRTSYGTDIYTEQDPLFIKCREVNDFHHAKDAYLNIVVGNVYDTKFTASKAIFIKEARENDYNYSLNMMYKYDVKRGNTVAWIGRRRDNEGSIATVRKMMKKNNILFTRMAKEVSGELFDINIVPKGKAQAMIKSSDPRMTTEKYGGYNKRSRAFFIVVEHRTDKGIVRSFEPVYLMHKAAFENNPTDYCRNILGLTEPRVIRKVKINSLLSLDGFRMHLSGANSETHLGLKDANQLVLEPSMVGYIKKVIKFNGRNREAAKFRKPLEKPERYKITQEKNCEVYDAFVKKLQNPPYNAKQQTPLSWLLKLRENFGQLNTIDQCKALEEILKCFECNAVCGHLKEYGGNDGFGILTLGRNLTMLKNCNFFLIDQSVTGFFEKRFDLLNDY